MEEEVSDIMRLLSSPPRERLPVYPFSLDEDLSLLAIGDGPAEFTLDRGCLDPELGNKCSPCFSFYRVGDLFKLSCLVPYVMLPSPVKHLLANAEPAEFLARCTRRMRAIDSLTETGGGAEFSTSIALASNLAGCVHHGIPKDPAGSIRASCTIVEAYPVFSSSFDEKAAPRADLNWATDKSPDTGVQMVDPISQVPWSAEGSTGKTCVMDFEVLPIDNRKKVPGQKLIHKFEHIMLPASVTWYSGTLTSLPCGVVGFPMVDEMFAKFGNDEAADQLCKKYWVTVQDELKERLQRIYGTPLRIKSMDVETRLSCKQRGVEELRIIIKNLLTDCFQGIRTGDLVCSMGKLVASNETMLAANYSTLPGSSGSAVFSPWFPVGTFIGVHAGGASPMAYADSIVYPDYNVATSTDNPAFFISYFENVVPSLPSPSAFEDEERAEAFRHYLLKHVKLIVRMKLQVTPKHEQWLQWAVQGEPLARNLFADSSQEDYPDVAPLLSLVSDQLLHISLRLRERDFHELPATLEELTVSLNDGTRREMFFAGIKDELERCGVEIKPWGLPVKVRNLAMLRKLALQLS